MGEISIVSWNVNGIRACYKKGLVEFLTKNNADTFCFQELKAKEEDIPREIKECDEYDKYWFPAKKKGYSGTAILTKLKPLNVFYGIGEDTFDSEGRTITLEFDNFYLVNAYFPNSQHDLKRLNFKIEFDRKIHAYLNTLTREKPTVLCGDFNVAHKESDLANPKQNEGNAGYTSEERAWMDEFLQDGYVDTFRMFTKEGGHYTWWTYRFKARQKNVGWRIDYFVVSNNIKQNVKSSQILSDIQGSDHAPIELKLKF